VGTVHAVSSSIAEQPGFVSRSLVEDREGARWIAACRPARRLSGCSRSTASVRILQSGTRSGGGDPAVRV
jgi:hypothetical protein